MAQDFSDFYQEYADMMNQSKQKEITKEDLQKNLEKDRHQRRLKTVRHSNTPLEKYELNVAEVAMANCKPKAEWQALEAEDIRMKATGVMIHKSVDELLERYRAKIQTVYRAEYWYEDQIEDCNARILELEKQTEALAKTNRKRTLKSAQNKLKHWRSRRAGLQCDLMRHWGKERRLEQKNMKWLGIGEKIKIADIARQIKEEKQGFGNKYACLC